jgi:hypothetical protein
VVKWEHRERAQKLATAVVAVLLVAAGGWLLGKVIEADDNSKSEASGATTTAPPDPEVEVEQAYIAYREMARRLLQAPDPADPEIAQRSTGTARERLEAVLNDLVASGDAAREGPTRSRTILSVEVSGDEATVRACLVDESGRFDAATGEAVEPMAVGTIIDTASLRRDEGVWRVASLKLPSPDERWEGVHSCPA